MPLTITVNKNTYRTGASDFGIPSEAVLPIYTASGGTGAITWGDGGKGGTFDVLNATQAQYRPVNRTQIINIIAIDQNGGSNGTAQKTLNVSATFPLNGQWGSEGGLSIETAIQKARGGTEYLREEEKMNFAQQIDCLNRRESTEGAALAAFFRFHRKVIPFYFLDTDTGELQMVKAVSDLRWRKSGGDTKDYFINVKGIDNELRLDFEPPEALIVTPANYATVAGTITLSASVKDNVGIQSVQFLVDGVGVGAVLTSPPFQINYNTTAVGNGKRIISCRARDTSNNISDAPARIVTVNN